MSSTYRHDLPTADRRRVGYKVRKDLQDRVRRYTRVRPITANRFHLDAIEAQLQGWIAEEMIGEDPGTGKPIHKPPGENFPSKPDVDFPRGGYPEEDRGDTVTITLRGDPALFDDWWAAVWHHPAYDYPGYAIDDAVLAYLEFLEKS